MPLERLFERHQQPILRNEYRTDLLHLFLTPVLTIAIGIIPLIVVLVALSPIPTLENVVASQPVWLQFLEVLLIGDLAGARSHPGGIISTVAIAIVPAYLVGFDTAVLGGFGAVQGLWAVWYHANVRWRMRSLDGVVATPEFHHWHHSVRRRPSTGTTPVCFLHGTSCSGPTTCPSISGRRTTACTRTCPPDGGRR